MGGWHFVRTLKYEVEPVSQRAVGRASGRGVCTGHSPEARRWVSGCPVVPHLKLVFQNPPAPRRWSPSLHPLPFSSLPHLCLLVPSSPKIVAFAYNLSLTCSLIAALPYFCKHTLLFVTHSSRLISGPDCFPLLLRLLERPDCGHDPLFSRIALGDLPSPHHCKERGLRCHQGPTDDICPGPLSVFIPRGLSCSALVSWFTSHRFERLCPWLLLPQFLLLTL